MSIIGIDLGTTFSAIATLNSIGKPEIVTNAEGERITASAIFFENDKKIFVGREAMNSCDIDDKRYVRWIKRFMGEEFYPKEIIGKQWAPAELSSLILKKLANDAETQVGGIRNVVITVPAYFDEVRRKATIDAGRIAKLNVVGIVNEPTAAALYYATEKNISGKTMVFDLGGGTFDITLLDIQGTDINIIASRGDNRLGGYDFDQKILTSMEKDYKDEFKSELFDTPNRRNRCEIDAEDIKKSLSKRDTVSKGVIGPSGVLNFTTTRKEFEDSISPLLAKIEMLMEDVLDESKHRATDIKQVLMVGGSTRIPIIRKIVSEMFLSEPLNIGNVDECVALGAAIYSGLNTVKNNPELLSVAAKERLENVNLDEVCNHSYGVHAVEMNPETKRDELYNSIIIPKNTQIPTENTQQYYTRHDNQVSIDIVITQGEGSDTDMVNTIATSTMELPSNRSAGQGIDITFSYDDNQMMKCKFHDLESGRVKEMDLDLGNNTKTESDDVDKIFEMFNID